MEELKKIFKLSDWRASLSCFTIAFAILMYYLAPFDSMCGLSGDAADIWKSITSFHTETIYPSYVLYKGFFSVHPYVTLYQTARYFNLNGFFFVKMYHAVLFAYLSGVGFPHLIQKIFKQPVPVWKRLLLIIALFKMWEYTKVYDQLMIDLPSATFFILAVNAVVKTKHITEKRSTWLQTIYCGVMLGVCMCLSGQYSLPAYTLLLYFFVKNINLREIRVRAKQKQALLLLLCLIVGILPVKMCNIYFESTVVQPMRDAGAWLPTGSEWTTAGLSKMIPQYRLFSPAMPNPRGEAMIIDTFGNQTDHSPQELIDSIRSGAVILDTKDIVSLYMKHPWDSLADIGNHFFLAVSFDDGRRSVSHLSVSILAVFLSLYCIAQSCKKISDIWKGYFLVVLAFLFAVAPLCVTQVENRCAIALHGLLIAVLLCSDTLWAGLTTYTKKIYNRIVKHSVEIIPFPKVGFAFLIFWIFALMHFGSLYELTDSSIASILFTS